MNISVAMTTYNGSRFLQAQLDSLATQVKLPAELVICDDGSDDDTVPIVQWKRGQYPLRKIADRHPMMSVGVKGGVPFTPTPFGLFESWPVAEIAGPRNCCGG